MGMVRMFEGGAEQDAMALVAMEDGSIEAAEMPTEVRDRLEELRIERESAISQLLFDRYSHPTAEARLTRMTQRVSALREADTNLRLAELDAESALQDQVRQQRALRESAERVRLEARASMPRWRQMAASILTLMTAHL